MLIFYEYPKCSTCKRAKAELHRLGLTFESIDLTKTPPSKATIKQWLKAGDKGKQNEKELAPRFQASSLKIFFNTSGQRYRELGLKDRLAELNLDEASSLLASDGMLIKRPVLVKDDEVLQIGYRTPYRELGL